jgi:hypothetical protein
MQMLPVSLRSQDVLRTHPQGSIEASGICPAMVDFLRDEPVIDRALLHFPIGGPPGRTPGLPSHDFIVHGDGEWPSTRSGRVRTPDRLGFPPPTCHQWVNLNPHRRADLGKDHSSDICLTYPPEPIAGRPRWERKTGKPENFDSKLNGVHKGYGTTRPVARPGPRDFVSCTPAAVPTDSANSLLAGVKRSPPVSRAFAGRIPFLLPRGSSDSSG